MTATRSLGNAPKSGGEKPSLHGRKHETAALTTMRYCISPTPRQGALRQAAACPLPGYREVFHSAPRAFFRARKNRSARFARILIAVHSLINQFENQIQDAVETIYDLNDEERKTLDSCEA